MRLLYTNKIGFRKFYPCENKTGEETSRPVRTFIETVDSPYYIHSDNHGKFKEGLFKKLMRNFGVHRIFAEPHSPWQNRAESVIGEVMTYARNLTQKTNTPIQLWCFCYEYAADLMCLLANGCFDLQDRTPYMVVLYYTPYISECMSYTWFP